MARPDDDWQRLLDGLRAADDEVTGDFYRQYAPLLERVAARHLDSMVQRRVDADDVVNSACRTFLRRVHGGQFELEQRDKLWHLLCAITVAKARKQARFHGAQRRALGRGAEVEAADDVSTPAPTPAEAAEFADQWQHLMATMEPEEQQILALKLERFTQDEIAARLSCSERTVRRILKRVEERLLQTLDEAG